MNVAKTETLVCKKGGGGVLRVRDVHGEEIRQVKEFKYLGIVLCEGRGSSRDLQERVKAEWRKWGGVIAVMKDKRMGMRLKAKVYQTVVRSVLTYDARCWALNKRDERLKVTEMNMLRRMLGVTRRDRLRNKEVRERTGVQENIVKVVERSKMRWYRHMMKKGERDEVRRAMDYPVMGKRNRGRQPKNGKWRDGVETRLKEWGVRREDALDRKRWRGIVAASGEGRG